MLQHKFKSEFTTNFELSKAKSAKSHNLTVVYLHGLCSDPWGAKPETVKKVCLEQGVDFLRFELAGHGSDKANYLKTDFNVWKEQVIEAIETMVNTQVIMVGSSVGGWLSLLAAENLPEKVVGVIALAAACDFQEDLYKYALTPEHLKALQAGNSISIGTADFSYIFTQRILDSCRDNSMLQRDIKINCPLHLIQGQKDASLPWDKALKIAEKIEGKEVVVKLLKNADHRLASPEAIEELQNSLVSLLTTLYYKR